MTVHLMKNKHRVYLLLCNYAIIFVGSGLFPILLFYASQFGATPTVVGIYYAFVQVASLAGTMSTSWLAARLTPRALFVANGAAGIAALVLLGQATALCQVVILTAIVWFCGFVGITLVTVFTGQAANGKNRGRSFSQMFLAYPLGTVLGVTTVSQLVAWLGYPAMFAALGALWTLVPVLGILGVGDRMVTPRVPSPAASVGARPSFGQNFYLLLVAALLSALAMNVGRLGGPLSMQALDYSPSAVASAATVSGLVAIPVVLAIGALSDRFGYRSVMMLTCIAAAGGLLILSTATDLWHFWLATTLIFVAWCACRSVSSACATEVLAPETLSRGLPRLSAVDTATRILGFAVTGHLLDTLGIASLYVVVALLGMLAVPALGRIRGQCDLPPRVVPRTVGSSPLEVS